MDARRWPTGIKPRGKGLQVEIWRGGKRVYSKILECDPFDAAALAAAVEHREDKLARLRLGLPLRQERTDLAVFSDVAFRWLSSLQIGENQIRGYHSVLNARWMPAYASWPVNEITTADIQERLASFGVSVKTQKNYLRPLRGTLKHAGINPNPADAVEWPRAARGKTRNKRRQRYSIAERDGLLQRLEALAIKHKQLALEKPSQKTLTDAHWSEQAALYFRLMFGLGTRPGELLALTNRHYDGAFMWIEGQFVRSKYHDETKTGHSRRVYVPQALRPHLDEHPSRFDKGPIMRAYNGGPLKDTKRLNPWWKEAHTAERIPYRDPYTCRHTRAAELLSQGVGAAEGAYQLGHSVSMFMELYSEFIEEYRGEQDWSRFEIAATQTPHRTAAKKRKAR